MRESDITGIERFLDLYLQEYLRRSAGQRDLESNLQMKFSHSLAVHELAHKLATKLNVDDQTTLQIRAAALLHDIGRFPQIIDCQTYEDVKSFNHAYLGAKILQEKGVTAYLGSEASETIEAAVRYHNKLTLPTELIGRARIVTEILRDADKIDIIRIAIEFYTSELKGHKTGWFTEMSFSPTYNPTTAAALLAWEAVPVAEISTVYDEFLLYLSWVNDLHFDISVQYLTKLGHWEYMVNALPEDNLRNQVADYMNQRVGGRCSG